VIVAPATAVPVTPEGWAEVGDEPPSLSDLTRLTRASVSVAVIGEPDVGVTVAEFEMVPVADNETVPVIVKVIEEPLGRSTPSAEMLPLPEAVVAVAPPEAAVTDHVSETRSAGTGSSTDAVFEAPVLETTTV